MSNEKSNKILCISVPVVITGLTIVTEFDVFLTVHHSIDLFQVTNLMHTSFIL